jgi:hypothetical protein
MTASLRKAMLIPVILATLALSLELGGCGGDGGFVFIAVNTGFVVSADACDGEFSMRNDGGLTLIVVIGSGTSIFLPNGTVGTCANIRPGTHASVRGPTQNGRVTANQVQLQ